MLFKLLTGPRTQHLPMPEDFERSWQISTEPLWLPPKGHDKALYLWHGVFKQSQTIVIATIETPDSFMGNEGDSYVGMVNEADIYSAVTDGENYLEILACSADNKASGGRLGACATALAIYGMPKG